MDGVHIDVTGFSWRTRSPVGHPDADPVFALSWLVIKMARKYFTRGRQISDQHLFLLSFFIPVFAVFLFVSFFYWVKLNWMMPAYISGIILLSIYLAKKWVKYQVLFSVVLHLAMAVEVIFYMVPVSRTILGFGWDQLAEKVAVIGRNIPPSFVFSADDYKTSAVLNFYSDSMIYSRNVIGENALQFDYIGTDLNLLKGRNALFINSGAAFHQ